jgi:hypothetical protein
MRRIALTALVVGGCSCNNDTHPVDAAPVVFMGEYVDFLSTENVFCGILDAKWTLHDRADLTDMTNPNGRVSFTLPPMERWQFDITPSARASECTMPPGQMYNVPGIAIVDAQVVAAGGEYSSRAYSTTVAQTFGFMPGLAQVLIHVDGTPRAVQIAAPHAATQAFTEAGGWAAGDTGENVFFPNVDPSSGTTMVTVTGGAVGTGEIPLSGGTFTYLTVIAN